MSDLCVRCCERPALGIVVVGQTIEDYALCKECLAVKRHVPWSQKPIPTTKPQEPGHQGGNH